MSKSILVTGATGYIAKHLIVQLLNAGHRVTGSLRNLSRGDELRAALAPHLNEAALLDNLSVVALDLSQDTGWEDAMQGIDVLMHTASPFPLTQTKDEQATIRPAVDGALRAVKAARAAGITRVIMTSSSVAIMNTDLEPGQNVYDERNWSDLDHPGANGYVKSKTMAERAVWDWQSKEAPDMQITMINPGFVQGAPLDAQYGTSVKVVARLLKGSDPMLPNFGFPCVDVKDIAAMHIAAMERPESIGQRYVGVDRFVWFPEMGRMLKEDFPERKIATRIAPNLIVRFLSLFDASIKTILPILGEEQQVSGDKARRDLGIAFRDSRQSIRETGAWLIENNQV